MRLSLPQPLCVDRNAGEQLIEAKDILLEVLNFLSGCRNLHIAGPQFQLKLFIIRILPDALHQPLLFALLFSQRFLQLLIIRGIDINSDKLIPARTVMGAYVHILIKHASVLDGLVPPRSVNLDVLIPASTIV
ncbi:MAG: hypothetical protein ACTFAK_09410 [Candidatus Electronema sp. VV]